MCREGSWLLQEIMRRGLAGCRTPKGTFAFTSFASVLPDTPPEALTLYGRLVVSHIYNKDVLMLPGIAASISPATTLFNVRPQEASPCLMLGSVLLACSLLALWQLWHQLRHLNF